MTATRDAQDTLGALAAPDAEDAVLGALLLRPNMLGEVGALVVPGDFYPPKYQELFAALLDMHEHGEPIDVVTVSARPDVHVPIEDLHRLQNETPSVSGLRRHCDLVIEASRRRRLLVHLGGLVERVKDAGVPVDDILASADPMTSDRMIADRNTALEGLYESATELMIAMDLSTGSAELLIPGILRRLWRFIVVAPEGAGKFVLLRQIALSAAAGRDPFDHSMFIDPIRCLVVDAENPSSTILHQMGIINPKINLIDESEDRLWTWHQEGGINLLARRDAARFEAVIAKAKPDLVVAGPLYKLFRRPNGSDMEQTTIDFLQVLDDLRTRYGFALMLEHHMAKGPSGGYRGVDPFGSSALMRWPEFGFALTEAGEGIGGANYDLNRFRRDREPANWPDKLTRSDAGNPFPGIAWTGTFSKGR